VSLTTVVVVWAETVATQLQSRMPAVDKMREKNPRAGVE
jgi:hypothetical protein